jgi:hypothetical protein
MLRDPHGVATRYDRAVFDLFSVRRRLELLREADRDRRVFGASDHGYQFEPPLAEPRLRSWERDHGIELPADYRAFIADLGNGGAGPFYGIFPLGLWDGAGGPFESWADTAGDLHAPFPHRAAWNLPASRLEPPEEFDSDDEEDAWHEALDDEYWAPSLTDGAFWVCHHGCALRTLLVVTGPERGNVWYDGRADTSGIAPHVDQDGRHLSFGDWYSVWLDRCLREVQR